MCSVDSFCTIYLLLVTVVFEDRVLDNWVTDASIKNQRLISSIPLPTVWGVFPVKMKNAFEPVKRDNSMNTYSRISTVPRGSERSE